MPEYETVKIYPPVKKLLKQTLTKYCKAEIKKEDIDPVLLEDLSKQMPIEDNLEVSNMSLLMIYLYLGNHIESKDIDNQIEIAELKEKIRDLQESLRTEREINDTLKEEEVTEAVAVAKIQKESKLSQSRYKESTEIIKQAGQLEVAKINQKGKLIETALKIAKDGKIDLNLDLEEFVKTGLEGFDKTVKVKDLKLIANGEIKDEN